MVASVDVLVVDHSAVEAELTLLMIRRAFPEARTLWLKSGDLTLQYLNALRESGGTHLPHLVLLELNLPVFSGLAVLDVMRSHPQTSDLPVALLSACCDPSVYQQGNKFDADAYVQKAFDHEEYFEQVSDLLHQWVPPADKTGPHAVDEYAPHSYQSDVSSGRGYRTGISG